MTTDKVISILGLTGAGKSTFLGVLNLALALEQSPWRIRPVGETIGKMSELMKYIYNGQYPPKTSEEKEMEFLVEKEATIMGLKPGAQFKLHAADVPGEATKGIYGVSIYHEFYEKYLKNCDGIIFLLDYKQKWLEGEQCGNNGNIDIYFPLFSSILAEISQQTTIQPYVVFCVTKVDLVNGHGPNSEFDRNGYVDDVEDLAEEIIGRNAKALIDHTFDSDHIFWLPVSATGFTGVDNKRVSQFFEKIDAGGVLISAIKIPKDLRPIGVAEAVEWVLDNLADDDEDVRITRTRGKKYADFVRGIRRFIGI